MTNKKTLKITGDFRYIDVFVPKLFWYLEKKDGENYHRAQNYKSVEFECNTGEIFMAHAYETKTMIVMGWSKVK